jgi:predicted aspartyl protease
MTGIRALIDTGATESCIDSVLAAHLNLPIIDRRMVAGIGGKQEVSIHLAQLHFPSLNFTLYGTFAGVHLDAGGQPHLALIGRTFLQGCTMTCEVRTGMVIISTD